MSFFPHTGSNWLFHKGFQGGLFLAGQAEPAKRSGADFVANQFEGFREDGSGLSRMAGSGNVPEQPVPERFWDVLVSEGGRFETLLL